VKKHIKRINIVLLILYIAFLLYLTLFKNFLGREEGIYAMNLVPFRNIYGITLGWIKGSLTFRFFIRNIFGNILAFAPFAYFFITIFNLKDIKKFIFLTSGIIVIIESSQYLMQIGVYDIDDIILNLNGSIIAFLIISKSKLIRKLINIGNYSDL